jgi:hypothetical protein
VHTGQKVSLEQIRAFLEASDEVQFQAQDKRQVYAWVERTLGEQGWNGLGRASRGLVRRYLEKMTGLSRAQITRLIKLYIEGKGVKPKSNRFTSRYSRADMELLASVDEAHETLSGPATQKILQREFHDFGHQQYERLAQNLGRSSVSIAAKPDVPATAHCLSADSPHADRHWRAASAAAGRTAWLPSCGYRAPRRSAGNERRVPHQRGRWGDAMAGGRSHAADQ